MGDFLIGTLFLREMSSPLVSAAKIMRRVSPTLPCISGFTSGCICSSLMHVLCYAKLFYDRSVLKVQLSTM